MAKRKRRSGYNVDDLINKIKENETKNSYNNDDPTEWKPKLKEDGSYSAIIRFLPPHLDEDLPFVKIYSHGWKDSHGGWFIDNCPTTLGRDHPCPVCKENGRIWEADEKTARPRSRKTSFWANILIVKDPQAPDTEGNVYKYRYGVKIHDKIMEKLNPEDPDIDPMVPIFDYEQGANFVLKIKRVSDWPNYDGCRFAEPTPIGLNGQSFDDDQLDELDGKLHKLTPIIAPSQFNSYAELAKKFTKKTGIPVSLDPDVETEVTSNAPSKSEDNEQEKEEKPKRAPRNSKKNQKAEKVEDSVEDQTDDSGDDFDADDDAFFKSLEEE